MKVDLSVKALLFAIAVSLGAIALRPYVAPPVVSAQSGEAGAFYVEPGVSMLRAPDGSQQVLGKVVVDLRNGNIWGFPRSNRIPIRRRVPERLHRLRIRSCSGGTRWEM